MIEQVLNVCRSTVVQEAWKRGQQLSVHGWVYSLTDGLIRDLQMSVGASRETSDAFQKSLAALRSRVPPDELNKIVSEKSLWMKLAPCEAGPGQFGPRDVQIWSHLADGLR